MKPSPRSQRHHVAYNTRVELLDTAHMHYIEKFSAIRESNATKFTVISSQGGIRTTCDMDYRGRILRAIGTPCYTPLTVQLAINPDSLVTMVKQMIDCIHDLRYKCNILHRGVGQSNIMYRKSSDGKDHFILVDFDHTAIFEESGQPHSYSPSVRRHITTLPFIPLALIRAMAVDEARLKMNRPTSHLSAMPHCVRFDFESLFWVALWCSICVVSSTKSSRNLVSPEEEAERLEKDLRDAYVARWEADSYRSIQAEKTVIMKEPDEIEVNITLSPAFEHLRGWLAALSQPFSAFYTARDQLDHTVDCDSYETGRGRVTRDKLLSALKEYEAQTPA